MERGEILHCCETALMLDGCDDVFELSILLNVQPLDVRLKDLPFLIVWNTGEGGRIYLHVQWVHDEVSVATSMAEG